MSALGRSGRGRRVLAWAVAGALAGAWGAAFGALPAGIEPAAGVEVPLRAEAEASSDAADGPLPVPTIPEGSPAASEAPPETEADEPPRDEGDEAAEASRVPDPLRVWNRVVFAVNDRLYFWVLRPAARAYRAVTPRPLRTGIKNFFHNLSTPVRFVNDALQGKGRAAGTELASFMINSTWGLGGLLDWTGRDPELQVPDEDTGQTLGRYGVGPGLYVVWPLFGPSTLRDTVGMVGDWFLDPVGYLRPPSASVGVTAGRKLNDLSFRLGDYEALKEAAIDPYEAVRDAYLQYRAAEIKK